eukprot:g3127.t1
MPYGKLPMVGGNVYLQTGKTLAKQGFLMAKKLWSRLSPEQKKQIISAGVNVAAAGARKAKAGLQQLSGKAEEKLANLLGKPASKKVSKKARSMLKDLVKENKPKVKLPKAVKKNLTKTEQQQLSKGGERIISNLLYGRGLKRMA